MKLFTCKEFEDFSECIENDFNEEQSKWNSYIVLRQHMKNGLEIDPKEMIEVDKKKFSDKHDEEVIKKIDSLSIDEITCFYLNVNFSFLKMYWERYTVLKAILEKLEKR